MNEQKNLLVTIAMVGAVLFGFYYFYERPKMDALREHMAQTAETTHIQRALEEALKPLSRSEAIQEDRRIKIETPSLHGSIALKGGRLDDLTLAHYHETTDPKSEEISLLSPERTPHPYFVEFGVHAADPNVSVPTSQTIWSLKEGRTLTPDTSVVLEWDNGHGLVFQRTFSIDKDYMFTIAHRIINKTAKIVRVTPYNTIIRTGTPQLADFFILHEGPIAVLNNKLQEWKYKDLREKGVIEHSTIGGWVGFADKYWLTAFIPHSSDRVTTRLHDNIHNDRDDYRIEVIEQTQDIAPHGTLETQGHLFAGAKKVHLLDYYEKTYDIPRFDLAIDFGWFYFLTKPIFYLLIKIHELLGNFGLSILVLTVLVKVLFFPLANKSYRSMAKMKQLQPELMKLKERYGDDKLKMNEAMMELYRKYQVNPLAGCLPMLLQIPVFFALYKVLFVTIEMRHAPFFGWIRDLSAPDPTTVFNIFGLIPWDPPSFLMLGAWPLLMGFTMFLQQRLNPNPTDPIQAKVFMFMPILFTFLLAQFSAGLVIYWAWNNILSIGQQWLIMRMESKHKLTPVKAGRKK